MRKITMEELRIKLAEIDGWEFEYENHLGQSFWSKPDHYGNTSIDELPQYDNETDILRVVRLLDALQLQEYSIKLAIKLRNGVAGPLCIVKNDLYNVATATAHQMLQAIANTLGYELEDSQ